MAKGSNQIIVGGVAFSVDWPTINFRDPEGFNAYLLDCVKEGPAASSKPCPGDRPHSPAKGLGTKNERFRPRRMERTLSAAQAMIKQFVIHLDGCKDAAMCFDVLQNERGLSCHFLIDNNGDIYQTLDLADCAYHAAGLNESSIGVEIANRGDARPIPDFYSRQGMQRDIVTCDIHNEKYVAFDFTPPQYLAMEHLARVLTRALPNIKVDYPQKSPGEQLWTTIIGNDPTSALLRESYAGYLGHYHITNQKWDPGAFDFKKFIAKIRGKRSFPIGVHGSTDIPHEPAEQAKAFQELYDNNEQIGQGGFFPVGPFDMYRVYHGGVHLHGKQGDRVIAPLQGYVVAARNGPPSEGIGSTNFVLVKHSMKAGGETLDFFSLYMHLEQESGGKSTADRPKWMAGEGFASTEPGRLVVLNPPEPIQASDLVGHVGSAGPMPEPQLHFEIFAAEHGPVDQLDANEHYWEVIHGEADGAFCKQKEILDRIEGKKKDGLISKDEELDYFHSNPDRDYMHRVVVYKYSEWTDEVNWANELGNAPEIKNRYKPREIQKLVDEQITPMIWWTKDTAPKLNLPGDGKAYHYHPIAFLKWLGDKIESKATQGSGGIAVATAADLASTVTHTAIGDFDDKEGTSFVNADDLKSNDQIKRFNLEELLDGFGE